MRLVDADALKEDVEFQQGHMFPEDLSYRIPRMIDNAPTIDAIPVEWLEAQNNSTEYYKTIQGQAVELILELWQKEQEAR